MNREFYADTIAGFQASSVDEIVGRLTQGSDFPVEPAQRDAWICEIEILRRVLGPHAGGIHFEYSIPRMGERIDVLLVIGPVIFVLEFKTGAREFTRYALDQVTDYALDLKNFHETSHDRFVAPVLIATAARSGGLPLVEETPARDGVLVPLRSNAEDLGDVLKRVLDYAAGERIDWAHWRSGRYSPTPTIMEAALTLYRQHSVAEISRSDAGAINLRQTSASISAIVQEAKERGRKSICFVTGVPGAGKTLVGLNIATKYIDKADAHHSVFLSGNGPLVKILQEALARDMVVRTKARGERIKKGEAKSRVKAFIQNVHHFRDEGLRDPQPPVDHVALFDEAQRAWNVAMTADFMKRKKKQPGFNRSEPEFLISCLDRHPDWAVVICLVGGGQEINRGEAGIGEWIESLMRSFPDWNVHISPQLKDSEYGAGAVLARIAAHRHVSLDPSLHLSVSMRSFRAENVSLLVKQVLDLDASGARRTLSELEERYPIAITRDLAKAKSWLRSRARGTERYGIMVSSQAERLKPEAIFVKAPMDPVHWFLDGKDDVRSSFYLEDVATEFHVQGLELDWGCVTWDADFRYSGDGWTHKSFLGDSWRNIKDPDRQTYQKNAYRVLLTRSRQGMIIVVPPGDKGDPTRLPSFYDPTYEYLRGIGFREI